MASSSRPRLGPRTRRGSASSWPCWARASRLEQRRGGPYIGGLPPRFFREPVMCEIFISADPAGYDGRTRSVRLHGVVTSIRLENLFWSVLEEIATRDGMGVV